MTQPSGEEASAQEDFRHPNVDIRPKFKCSAPRDSPCAHKVVVEGAVCGFCMYDGYDGEAYPDDTYGWWDAYHKLYQCYKNSGKLFPELRSRRRLAAQGKSSSK